MGHLGFQRVPPRHIALVLSGLVVALLLAVPQLRLQESLVADQQSLLSLQMGSIVCTGSFTTLQYFKCTTLLLQGSAQVSDLWVVHDRGW